VYKSEITNPIKKHNRRDDDCVRKIYYILGNFVDCIRRSKTSISYRKIILVLFLIIRIGNNPMIVLLN